MKSTMSALVCPLVCAAGAAVAVTVKEDASGHVILANDAVALAFSVSSGTYAITDLANMRALPNLTVIVPADAAEAAAWVPIVAEYDGPVYLRISRAPALPVYRSNRHLRIGKGLTLKEGSDVTLVAIGAMTGRCLQAADELAAAGIQARVLEIHSLKPFDKNVILKAAEETSALVTAEEHSIIGGLGSAVAEVLSESRPTPLQRVGIPDRFCPTGRNLDKLMDACGLSITAIVAAAHSVLERKAGRHS